jgi:hypothetical protein
MMGGLLAMACGGEGEGLEEWPELGSLEQGIEGGDALSTGRGAVRVRIDGGGICSGAIIGPRTFITDAHCANKKGKGDRTVSAKVEYFDAGSWLCLSDEDITFAKCSDAQPGQAWINPDHTGSVSTDFAVVTMDRDFSYIRSAHAMLIMEEPTKAAIGNFQAIGYGVVRDGGSVSNAPMLAEFTVEAMGSRTFHSLGGKLLGEDEDTGMRLCAGDSGSPQFEPRGTSRMVFGLHKKRVPEIGDCAEEGTEQHGVLVGQYMDEIEDNMGRSCRHIRFSGYGKVADCW